MYNHRFNTTVNFIFQEKNRFDFITNSLFFRIAQLWIQRHIWGHMLVCLFETNREQMWSDKHSKCPKLKKSFSLYAKFLDSILNCLHEFSLPSVKPRSMSSSDFVKINFFDRGC